MDLQLLWWIQLAPLAAFLVIQLLPKNLKKIAPVVGILFSLAAAVSSIKLLLLHLHSENLPLHFSNPWLSMVSQKGTMLVVGFLVDPLNLLMITLVTVISFFVQIFSFYYMAEDTSRARYFAFLSFFSFTMTGLVLSSNLFQTFVFWELVGLASYLLIGFYYEKPSAATAARKAFTINRLADLGFYLGIAFLFLLFGSLNFTDLHSAALKAAFSPTSLTIIALLVFMGVMGKSAQFPFHVWLPDAMEGPTPVSALIHSATMVAAGVFLLARVQGLFFSSELALQVISIIGILTALTGAFLATAQRDIKKILAYSTISQLGLMVAGIGAASAVAGIFHLTTHAFFKSMLFLTSGAFIHRFHSNDIWEIGRKGGKKDILAMGCLALGLLSLSGIPPFSGFFSKDMILEALRERNFILYLAGLLVSFLTVYYSFRLFFVLTFSRLDSHAHDHGHHDSLLLNICRALPLLSLGALSLFAGFLGTKTGHFAILHWLGGHDSHMNWEIVGTTTVLIVAAAILAYFQFKDPAAAEAKLKNPGSFGKILENKFYMDAAYDFFVKKVGLALAGMLNWFDRTVINGWMVNGTSFKILRLGKETSRIQGGLLQDYLAWAVGAGILILFYLLGRGL